MKDVQSTTDNRGIAIQRVGIKDAYLPFLIKTKAGGYQQVGAKISFAVALPMEYKGTHMSRFLEILNPWSQKPVAEPELAEILKEALEKLKASRVAVFGIGGVGGYVCEALVRTGVGAFDLIDDDKVCLTNLNRQIIATRKTVGQYKTDVMKERIHDINPDADVRVHQCFFLPENADRFPFEEYDYIVDAVDTVTAKIALVMKAQEMNIPIISSMGAGNKLDAGAFRVADIYETKVCPLAKVMRRELKKRNVKHLKVVYSEEEPITPVIDESNSCKNHCICPPGTQRKCTVRRAIPGSVAFVPSVVGLMIAGEVVKDLITNWHD